MSEIRGWIAFRAWEKPGNDDGGGGSSFRLAKAGGCDAMRCDAAQSPGARQIRDQARLCQGVYFYKTRRPD